MSTLKGSKKGTFSLGIRVGEEVPDEIPLNLVVEADGFREPLAKWPLQLPVDGKRIQVQAPQIDRLSIPIVAPVGPFELPIKVKDERQVQYVVVYANGEKSAWIPGTNGTIEQTVPIQLIAGRNRIVILSKDDEGLTTRRSVRIWGEEATSVDAANPQNP